MPRVLLDPAKISRQPVAAPRAAGATLKRAEDLLEQQAYFLDQAVKFAQPVREAIAFKRAGHDARRMRSQRQASKGSRWMRPWLSADTRY